MVPQTKDVVESENIENNQNTATGMNQEQKKKKKKKMKLKGQNVTVIIKLQQIIVLRFRNRLSSDSTSQIRPNFVYEISFAMFTFSTRKDGADVTDDRNMKVSFISDVLIRTVCLNQDIF